MGPALAVPGIQDECVHRAERPAVQVDDRGQCRVLRHVGAAVDHLRCAGLAQLGGKSLEVGLLARGDREPEALLRQTQRDPASDTPGRAGDERGSHAAVLKVVRASSR